VYKVCVHISWGSSGRASNDNGVVDDDIFWLTR